MFLALSCDSPLCGKFSKCLCIFVTVLSPSVLSDSLRPHGLQPARLLCPWGFSRQEYWSGLPCPLPGDLPNPGIVEPRSPTLQADSLPSELPGKLPEAASTLANWDLGHTREVLQLFSCCSPICTTHSVWWIVAPQVGLLDAVLQWVLWLPLWVSLVLSTKSFWYSPL